MPSNALNFFAYVFCKSYAAGPVHMLSSMVRKEVVFYAEEDLNQFLAVSLSLM